MHDVHHTMHAARVSTSHVRSDIMQNPSCTMHMHHAPHMPLRTLLAVAAPRLKSPAHCSVLCMCAVHVCSVLSCSDTCLCPVSDTDCVACTDVALSVCARCHPRWHIATPRYHHMARQHTHIHTIHTCSAYHHMCIIGTRDIPCGASRDGCISQPS